MLHLTILPIHRLSLYHHHRGMHSAHPFASSGGQLRCEKRLSCRFLNRISAAHPLSSTSNIYFRANKKPAFREKRGFSIWWS